MSARSMQRKHRKRAALSAYKVATRGQPAFKAPYTGFLAYGVELGIPEVPAANLAFSFLDRPQATISEVIAEFEAEASIWN